MCSIDLHIIQSYLFRIILDSKSFNKIQFLHGIYEAKGLLTHLLTHGVTETCNKYHAFLYGHISDDAWPSVIIMHTCNSGLTQVYALFDNHF